jgi:dihydroorotate dehydrogenase (NAD+) catalytic subunit
MDKQELQLDRPLMNAAGMLGFSPDLRHLPGAERLGAFVTNPISLAPRSPAQGRRWAAFPGGFLLHTGHPNPGLSAVLRRHAARWAAAGLPVVVHLLAGEADEVAQMVARLESVEGVAAIELGLPPRAGGEQTIRLAMAASGELPVIPRLPFERAVHLGMLLAEKGFRAVSLGPPRGMLPAPGGGLAAGRLYGPALLPAALATVRDLARQGLSVIGAGGVSSLADIQAMHTAGASAVQLDWILWREGVP